MDEVLLMTGVFAAGASVGALFTYVRDRGLLRLYGHLVEDLSRMIPRAHPDPPKAPALAARITKLPAVVESQRKAVS